MGLIIDQLIEPILAFEFDRDVQGLGFDCDIFDFWTNINIFGVRDKKYLKSSTFFWQSDLNRIDPVEIFSRLFGAKPEK